MLIKPSRGEIMKKILCIGICAILALSGISFACFATLQAKGASTEPPVYLALGDSISYGYTVDAGQRTDTCFVRMLAENKGLNAINESISGNEAPDVIEQLNSGELDETIKKASIVTLTIGGNDMMEVLYQKTADAYNSTWSASITADDVSSMLMNNPDWKLMLALGIALNGIDTSTEFTTALSDFIDNVNTITSYIKGKNSSVKIYLATQYDPYQHFSGTYASYTQNIGKCLAKMRQAEIDNQTTGQYESVDVYTAFQGNSATYCYASEDPLVFDFHPNEAGHAAIAQCFIDAVTVD